MILGVLRDAGQESAKCSQLRFVWWFSHDFSSVWRTKTLEVKYHFTTSHQGNICQCDLLLAQVVFIRFNHHKLIPHPPYYNIWGGSHCVQSSPHWTSWYLTSFWLNFLISKIIDKMNIISSLCIITTCKAWHWHGCSHIYSLTYLTNMFWVPLQCLVQC